MTDPDARAAPSTQPVTVVNFNVPFWSLVRFLVKLAFASIPAAILIALLILIGTALIGGIGSSLRYHRTANVESAPVAGGQPITADIATDSSPAIAQPSAEEAAAAEAKIATNRKAIDVAIHRVKALLANHNSLDAFSAALAAREMPNPSSDQRRDIARLVDRAGSPD